MDHSNRSGRRQTAAAAHSRSLLGFWVPVVLTASAAVIGITAWIWNERQHDESEDETTDTDRYNKEGKRPEYNDGPSRRPEYGDAASTRLQGEPSTIASRVSGALRRTPSPQQIYDGASKKLAAGAAAATAVGASALAAIREDDKEEHLQYGAESTGDRRTVASAPSPAVSSTSQATVVPVSKPTSSATGRRKTAVLVVSSEADLDSLQDASEGVDPDLVVCVRSIR